MSAAFGDVALPAIASLAWRDVVHERLLSTCLIVALAGLLSPLLVLFGLKAGVIETMRETLLEDPAYRELRPLETMNYPEEFFTALRARPETEFVVESVLRGASTIRVERASGGKGLFIDMLPSATGDPVLLAHGLEAPPPGTVVLSAAAAAALAAAHEGEAERARPIARGEPLVLRSARTDGDRRREALATMAVHGVLPPAADPVARLYVPRDFALDVESFREGFAVPARRWAGEARGVAPLYHGVVVALAEPLGTIARGRLTSNTVFYRVEPIDAATFARRFGLEPPAAARELLDVRVIDRPAGDESLARLRRNAAGSLLGSWPYVEGLALDLQLPDESWRRLAVQISPGEALEAGAIALPESLDARLPPGAPATLRLVGAAAPLTFTRPRAAPVGAEHARLGARQAGILLQGLERALEHDPEEGRFSLRPLGYRSFRLFARRLEDVAPLGHYLRERGVETHSAVREIRRLQALDRGLASLFRIIAAATLVTGAIVLLASQYGAVERKRAALAQLRLMGLSRRAVALVPIVQGLVLALAGAAFGALATGLVCALINRFLAASLGFGESICALGGAPLALAVGLAAALSLLASLGAAFAATRIDPAEGMRDE